MRIRIAKGSGFAMHGDCRGGCIRCDEGIVWLTQANDPVDHFLQRGEEFALDRKGTIIVEARRDACVVITAAAGPLRPRWL